MPYIIRFHCSLFSPYSLLCVSVYAYTSWKLSPFPPFFCYFSIMLAKAGVARGILETWGKKLIFFCQLCIADILKRRDLFYRCTHTLLVCLFVCMQKISKRLNRSISIFFGNSYNFRKVTGWSEFKSFPIKKFYFLKSRKNFFVIVWYFKKRKATILS